MDYSENIDQLIDEKVELAFEIIDKLEDDYGHIEGARKMKKIVETELNFLKKLKQNCDENARLKLQCTNLSYYSHLVECIKEYEKNLKIVAIYDDRKKDIHDIYSDSKYRVDILCEDEKSKQQIWVKVIARSSIGISDIVAGNCSFGTKSIVEVAEEYVELSKNVFSPFAAPIIIFDFLNKISDVLSEQLEEMGIVIGKKYRRGEVKLDEENLKLDLPLNLDITTLLAYVSDLSNGGRKSFNNEIINFQAKNEQKNPVRAFLDKTFEGKRLITCETAYNDFQAIIGTLGGPKERKRAEELMGRVEVLPDVQNPEDIIRAEISNQIKERSRKIFAFGIDRKAITVTSNSGFIRSAKYLNLDIPHILHKPRALTEAYATEQV